MAGTMTDLSTTMRVDEPSAPRQPDLSLVVPCYNEAESIATTARELVEAFQRHRVELELVLVDNGSSDGTGKIIDDLIAAGLPVVKETVEVNQGYGHGVLRGLAACRGSFVGLVCADGQVAAEDVVKVYEMAARAKTPKLVKVRRRFRMDGHIRKIVSIAYNALANVVFGGLGSLDVNGNPKIFPREYLYRMNLSAVDWFLDAEIMIAAKRLGLPVLEFNILAQMREAGASNVRASTCWEFTVNLVRWRLGGHRSLRHAAATPVGGAVERPRL
jgi:glycosyltransferase involved in cell wall biosynthesis